MLKYLGMIYETFTVKKVGGHLNIYHGYHITSGMGKIAQTWRHTKAFDYPVVDHWGESRGGQFSSGRWTRTNDLSVHSRIC